MTADDPRMRFRVWIAGVLADEVWVDASSPDADRQVAQASYQHHVLTAAATARGDSWSLEMFDPAQPADRAYVRVSSDDP